MVLACIATRLCAQTPLPQEMQVRSWTHSAAAAFRLPTSQPAKVIQCRVSYTNMDPSNKIDIEWKFKTAGGTGIKRTSHSVSFQPTAVCPRAGRTSTLYVAGWSPRASKVVVEEWTFNDMALVETVSPTGKLSVSLSGPSIQRTMLAATQSVAPVLGMAVNPWSDQIYLLERSTPRAIRTMDASTGAIAAPLLTSVQEPDMASHRSLRAGKTPLGLYIFSEQRRPWMGFNDGSPPYTLVFMQDANLDGVVDHVQATTVQAFQGAHLGQWDEQYTGP